MSMFTIPRKCGRGTLPLQDAATWLCFAASPTFALMAWISANGMQAIICASGPGGLLNGGMPLMYLLMSFFHLPPWLRFVSALSRQSTQTSTQIQGE